MNTHYVYRAYSGSGDLLYVGCTGSLAERLTAHRRAAPWVSSDTRFEAEGPMTAVDAYSRERSLISACAPRFNKRPGVSGATTVHRMVTLRLDADLGVAMQAVSADTGANRSEVIRALLAGALASDEIVKQIKAKLVDRV